MYPFGVLVKKNAHLTEEGLSNIRKMSKEINLITSVTNKTVPVGAG